MRILCGAGLVVCLAFPGWAATAPKVLKAIRSNDVAALREGAGGTCWKRAAGWAELPCIMRRCTGLRKR